MSAGHSESGWRTVPGTSCLDTCHGDNSSSVKALAINLSQRILWKMTPVLERCGEHVYNACLHSRVPSLSVHPELHVLALHYVTSMQGVHIQMRRRCVCVCVSEKYGFKAAWFYLFVVVMIEHLIQQYTNTHSWTLCRFFFFFFYTQPQTCASRHIDTTTHTRRHTNTHWRIYGSSESGLLMERLPLINASFNDSLLKTGGRVIVCFSSSRAGKKWNDVEIYDICSPVRQNY